MFDHLLSKQALDFREEIRDLVRWVPREMILAMDQEQITFPKEFLQEAGRRNLMGCRYPKKWGGREMATELRPVPRRGRGCNPLRPGGG